MYNWYNKLNVVVKWNGSYSKSFCVTRGTRQGSVLWPYLFNIFINQLLLDFNNCDAGVRIGDTLYNCMAYADDNTLFSTNVQDLQNLIDVCVAYSKRWRFKFGVEKSKCMIVGKFSLYQDPKWRLGDKCLCNEESLNILGNVFNRGGNNASHVTNRLTKCRQSFYGLGHAGMLYPGATPDRDPESQFEKLLPLRNRDSPRIVPHCAHARGDAQGQSGGSSQDVVSVCLH